MTLHIFEGTIYSTCI